MIWIGRFRETHNKAEYPSILAAIHNEPPKDKAKILKHLKAGSVTHLAPGYLHDRINGGLIMKPACMTDGKYSWRSDLIYYYEKYNVDLPDDFIAHVLKNK